MDVTKYSLGKPNPARRVIICGLSFCAETRGVLASWISRARKSFPSVAFTGRELARISDMPFQSCAGQKAGSNNAGHEKAVGG